MTAHSALQTLSSNFYYFSTDVDAIAIINIQVYRNKATDELNQLKQLAEAANADVSVCTDGTEQSLHDLLDQKLALMRSCMAAIRIQATEVITNSKYIVDVLYNKVNALEFQINQCSSDVCLEPIIQTITLDSVDIPQKIDVEVNSATTLLEPLKSDTHECRNNDEAQYVASADIILNEIKNCINNILTKI